MDDTGTAGDARRTAEVTRTALRNAQHEVRTRVGQVIGYGELLAEELRDRGLADLVPDVERIVTAGHGLLDVVEGRLAPVGERAPRSPDGGATSSPLGDGASTGRAGRILVVDDDVANRDLLRRHLERAGYVVIEAGNGRVAARLVATETFDLVLLDLIMPEMDGRQTLRQLRRERSATELPVIVVTGLTDRREVVDALGAGANDYVTKPLDFDVVLARVTLQTALRRSALDVEELMRELEVRNAFLRRMFGRYVSDDVAQSLLGSDEGPELAGEKRTITVLMADLRGFTALAERADPATVVAVLNDYLATMSMHIADHHGTVNEYLGDGIIAFFGALEQRPDDPRAAVACARAMHRSLPDVNRRIGRRGSITLEMGIGIATGEVVVGNVGSEQRSKFTAIGSAVNLAARLEGFAAPGEVVISPATYDEVRDHLADARLRWVDPKGFDGPVPCRVLVSPL